MGINTYEVMYIQAKDNYPYNVEECIEKLQYVISGNDEHAGAHCLMGQIFEEQLQDYKQAEHYYRMTLYLDRHYAPVYYSLANLLLRLNRFEESVKIIDLGLKVSGADIAALLYLKGLVYEKYEMYSTAISFYNEAKKNCLNSSFMDAMDCHIKRVKDKKALLKKQEKRKINPKRKRTSLNRNLLKANRSL